MLMGEAGGKLNETRNMCCWSEGSRYCSARM